MAEIKKGKYIGPNIRLLIGLFGFSLILAGQWKINLQLPTEGLPLSLGIWLTQQIHLGDPNIDQVLYSLPLFVAGFILLYFSLHGIHLLPQLQQKFNETPLDIGFLRSKWQWFFAAIGFYILFILKLGTNDFSTLEVPVWLISISLIAVALFYWDRNRKIDLSPHISRHDLLWILGILIAGIIVGAYRLQGLPDQLIGDEGNFWTTARDIAINKFNPSVFAPGVYSFPVFSSIIQSWFLKIFGISLWGWRFGSVLMGLATIFPLYLLAREFFDRRIAISTSIILIASPYFIDFSRLGYNNIQALVFTTLTLYLLYLGMIRKSSLYLYFAGFMAGLDFYTFFAARMAIVISLLFIFMIWIGKKLKSQTVIYTISILILGFTLVVTPYIIYGTRLNPQGLSYKTFESAFFNSFNGLQFYSRAELFAVAPPIEFNGNELFYNPKVYAVLIARGFIRTILSFQDSGLISEHYIAFPLSGTWGAVFYLLGLAVVFSTVKQSRSLLLLIWFFVNVIGLSTLNTVPPRQTHLVAIIPALAILTALGINAIATGFSALNYRFKYIGFLIFFSLMGLTFVGGLYDYFIRVPDQYHAQPGEVISWATLESHNDSIVYIYSNPSQKGFVPYSMVFRNDVSYQAISTQAVISGEQGFTSQPTIIFFSPDVAEEIMPVLENQWGESLIRRTFYSSRGDLVLLAAMNTPFIFDQYKDLTIILKDSYFVPSLDILLGVLTGLFILIIFIPKPFKPLIPTQLKHLVEWFNAPSEYNPTEQSSIWPNELLIATPDLGDQMVDPPEWALDTSENSDPGHLSHNTPKSISKDSYANSNFRILLSNPKLVIQRINFIWTDLKENLKSGFFVTMPLVPYPALLVCGVIIGTTAQLLIFSQLTLFGVIAYASSATLLILWARFNPRWINVFSQQLNLTPAVEFLGAGLILLIAIFVRFFDLNYRVYGLEADETKWTVQSWYSTILHVDLGEFAGMHYKYLPVDFWVRSIFLRIFGLNFISARIESAVLSLLSILFLYLLVRLLTTSSAVALLSALLFSLSFVELNASHQALHNTPPETWMVCSLYFMFLSIRRGKLWLFQLTGILLALGMLTYETFYPTSVVAIVYLLGISTFEISRKTESVRNWFTRLTIVSWPVILVYFTFSRPYLAGRQGYLFGWLNYFSIDGHDLSGAISFILVNARDVLITIFSHVVFTDSLINWTGPFINPLLLPFVVIGFIYNLWNIRHPPYLFILLWYLFHTLLGPIILGSVWPRVMYLTLPPLMIWGALGLWTTFAALRAIFRGQSFKFVAPAFSLLIIVIVLNDYHIFSSQLLDPVERQKRRELADLTYSSATLTPMILFPYLPSQNDSLELESHILLYSVAGARHLGLDAANFYKQVTESSLLPTLWQLKNIDSLDLFFDKTTNSFQDERINSLHDVLYCYPHAILKSSARFFDVYHLGSQDLKNPTCYSPPIPIAMAPKENINIGSEKPIVFKWNNNNIITSSFTLTLERKLDDIFWIEAENFKGPGWHQESNFVYNFSGSGFLVDDFHAGQANYVFNVPSAGQYKVWVRFYKRRDNDQHNFIYIAGKYLEFAGNESILNEWVWKDMGKYDLIAGQLPLGLARTYGLDEQYSVFIDSVVVTSNLNYQPDGEDSEWQIIKSTGEVDSSASEYSMDISLSPGEYRWKVRLFDANRIVDSAGKRGVETDVTNFVVH